MLMLSLSRNTWQYLITRRRIVEYNSFISPYFAVTSSAVSSIKMVGMILQLTQQSLSDTSINVPILSGAEGGSPTWR